MSFVAKKVMKTSRGLCPGHAQAHHLQAFAPGILLLCSHVRSQHLHAFDWTQGCEHDRRIKCSGESLGCARVRLDIVCLLLLRA